MQQLSINGQNGVSDILIGGGILGQVALRCAARFAPSRVHIVTDTNVAPLYLAQVRGQFSLPTSVTILPAGEEHKRLSTVETLYHDFCDAGITRKDLIIALGGGVTGDMAGFAAATFLRGVAVCQIPTTLLAQVDSSVGGKTGVDLPQGKNLVGAFYQPGLVLIDPDILKSLPQEIFSDGMAEVIKYGCIANRKILDMAAAADFRTHLQDMVYECVKVKRDIVAVDEHDTGLRMILNFGHTLGHAAEKLGNYTALTHGQAVSIGMVAAMRVSNLLNAPQDLVLPLQAILRSHHLPTELTYNRAALADALLSDKKNFGGTVSFILVREFGKAEILPISAAQLRELILAI